MTRSFGQDAAETVSRGISRRDLMRVAVAFGATGAVAAATSGCAPRSGAGTTAATGAAATTAFGTTPAVLQPGKGTISGDHYLESNLDTVLWGYVPTVHAAAALTMKSGETVTIDAVSHEGILEDQGRDPREYFGSQGVSESDVLQDAIDIAADYDRTTRDFAKDGPHVVTGPVFVEGAEVGDVLKIETLEAAPRVPYGVVSSRHGKGSLAVTADGGAPAGISLDEVMPPRDTDGRDSSDPTTWGNVSVFTPIEEGRVLMADGKVKFPIKPFMGMMGVAFSQGDGLTDDSANSIPPTLGGGNIDINHLGVGSTFYLPVHADGALFYVGDPHHAMGHGEVALTAMEGSLRGTFRLTVCKPGSGDAPSVAYDYPFAETEDSWIPIGLSDPDGSIDGQNTDLNVAMRRAVVNALDFLQDDQGMDRATAYAYLSAAADFIVSQVVDRTVGVHALITKAHFE